jgi:hypothetical protein
MSEHVIDPAGECKPAISPSDAAELVRAMRARSPARLNQLMKLHRDRGLSDREIVEAMARSAHLVNAIGAGRQRP